MNESPAVPPAEGDRTVEDAVVARLRAADPAKGVEPDAAVLRTSVDHRIATGSDVLPSSGVGEHSTGERPAAEHPAAEHPATGEQPADELAAARARRRRWTSWPVRVAGVAAGALVVGGGGGYAIGAAGDGTAPPTAGEVITLQDGGGSGSTDAAAPMDGPTGPMLAGPEVAADAGSRMSAGGADMAYWPGYGRTVFTAQGLSQEGGRAQAWAFDPAQTFTQETATRLAAAFGVSGTPVLTDGYWLVGPNDGTGPNVSLYADGTGSASFYDPTKDPWSCVSTMEGGAPDEPSTPEQQSDPSAGMIAPDPCTERDLGPAPQGDAATGRVTDLLNALGQDPAGFELVVEDYGDTHWSYVTAYQVIDGQRTGATMSFSFTGSGLQSFNGALAPVVSLGEYAVISPAEAVDRLADPRFGGGWGGPIAYLDGAGPRADDLATSSAPSTPTVPTTPSAGSAISWPVDEVTIVEARLGTAMHTQADGATVLLPTYELISADGGIWSMLAVADAHLDFSSGR